MTYQTTQTITITDVNDKPTDIALSNATVVENAVGAIIGTLSTTDPDGVASGFAGPFSYTVSDARFEVVSDQLKLKAGQSLDREAAATVNVTVTTTDAGGQSYSKGFALTVTDVNDNAPVITTNAAQYVNENSAFSVRLAATDVDLVGANPPTFTITGGADQALFGLDAAGNLTLTAKNYEVPLDSDLNNSYVVQVTANDGLNSSSRIITVNINNLDETAPIVASGQSFYYLESQAPNAVVANVAASDDIGVTGFRFDNGGGTYSNISADGYFQIDNTGRITLTPAGAVEDKLNPNNSAPSNDYEALPNDFTLGVQARDAFGRWSATQNVTLNVLNLDEAPPEIVAPFSFNYAENQLAGAVIADVEATDDVSVTGFRFVLGYDHDSNPVTPVDTSISYDGYFQIASDGRITLTAAGAAAISPVNDWENGYNNGGAGFTYAIQARDAVGNWSVSKDITLNVTDVDETSTFGATITISDDTLNLSNITTAPVTVTIAFDEVVTEFDLGDLSAEHGTFSNLSQVDAQTYTATFTPNTGVTDLSNVITLDKTGVKGLDTNWGTGTDVSGNFEIDTKSPTATIVVGSTNLKVGQSTGVTFIFSEAVTDFTNSDLTFANGTLSTVTALNGTGTDSIWTATFTPTPGVEAIDNVITLNDGSIFDVAGNPNSGTANSTLFNIDTKAPTVLFVNVSDTLITDIDTGAGKTFFVEVIFDQAMKTSVTPLLTFSPAIGGALINPVANWSVGDTTYKVTYEVVDTNVNLTNITIDVTGAQDVNGNLQVNYVQQPEFSIDTLNPAVTSVIAGDSMITDADTGAGKTFSIAVTFDQAMDKAFTPTLVFSQTIDGTLMNGVGAWSNADKTYTVTYDVVDANANLANITVDVLDARDVNGNLQYDYAAQAEFSIDTLNPSILAVTASSPMINEASAGAAKFSLTVIFDQAMDTAVAPTLVFAPVVAATLGNPVGAWSNGGTTYTVTYDVTDANVELSDITVDVTGARDVNGNLQTDYTAQPEFDIDTIAPNPTITVNAITSDNTIDFIEAKGMVTITGSVGNGAVTGDTVELRLVGTNPFTGAYDKIYTGTVDAFNHFSITVSGAELAYDTDRTIDFTMTATDAAGNQGVPVPPATKTYTVDVSDPKFNAGLYTSPEYKLTGGTGIPQGHTDSSAAAQAKREVIDRRTDGNVNNTIQHNALFSANSSLWAKTLKLDFNVFTTITSVVVVASQILPGFALEVQGATVSKVGSTWTITPDTPAVEADWAANGMEIKLVYAVADDAVPVNFTLDVTASGDAGGPESYNETLSFAYKDATTEGDFAGPSLVLPSAGIGVDIYAGDGDDLVDAGAGDDRIYGDAGNDTLKGGIGNDTIYGGTGNDLLYGEAGDDFLYGEDGDDTLIGGAGNDLLDGGTGSDTVSYEDQTAAVVATLQDGTGSYVGSSSAGTDTYRGIENLTGGGGNDILTGNASANILKGGDGNDTLVGGVGGDTFYGGDEFTDTSANDTVSYAGAPSGVVASLTGGLVTQTGDADGDTFFGIENLTGTAQADTLIGDDKVNILTGGAGDDILEGMAGADILNGDGGSNYASYAHAPDGGGSVGVTASLANPGTNTGHAAGDQYNSITNLIGSSFNDTLTGRDGEDNILIGGAGADVLKGGTGNDTASYIYDTAGVTVSLVAGAGSGGEAQGDTLFDIENLIGGSGNDNLTGNSSVNILKGGGGDDTLIGGAGGDTFYGGDEITDTSTNDTVSYASASSGVFASLTATIPQPGGTSDDATGDTFFGVENLTGTAQADTLIGDDKVNILTGGAGEDILEGMAGGDILNGDGGSNYASYAHAPATAGATGVSASLASPAGNTGHAAGDQYNNITNLIGSAFNDTLTGRDGEDNILIGGAGADVLNGGTGSDTASYATATAGIVASLANPGSNTGDAAGDTYTSIENLVGSSFNDTLSGDANNNILNGGAGNDTVSYVGITSTIVATLTEAGGSATGTGIGTDTYFEIENITGGSGADNLYGNSSANILSGGVGSDTLDGKGGNDTLYGNEGNDVLYGGDGDDILDGGDGNDQLYGNAGADTLVGGLGIDTADYSTSLSAVAIALGGTPGSGGDAQGDTLSGIENIVGSAGDDTLTGDSGSNVLSGGAGHDYLYGLGGSDTLLGMAGDDHLYGGDGDDTLSGGDGDDFLYGEAGNDVLRGNASVGHNTLDGGAGDDTLYGEDGVDWMIGGTHATLGDTAYYGNSATNIVASLATGMGTGGAAAGDTYVGIENLTGGNGNDILIGDGGANKLTGNSGNDILEGGAGADFLDGGIHIATGSGSTLSGGDTASYVNATADVNGVGVVASLTLPAFFPNGTPAVVLYGEAAGDTYANIENLTGSAYHDTLIGDGVANILNGGAGDDTLEGMDGADYLIGGDGNDTASYAHANEGVSVTLVSGDAHFGSDAVGDDFDSIENLLGSKFDDFLGGDGNANILTGDMGNDTLRGEGGDDLLYANQGHDLAYGGDGNDTIHVSTAAANSPTLIDGGPGTDTLVLQGLGGSYSLTALAGVSTSVETLDINDGTATTLTVTSQDIRDMVDSGNASQLSINANTGDVLNISLAAGESLSTVAHAGHTDYIITHTVDGQVAQVHWQTT